MQRSRADARLDQALERDALRDPRAFFRHALRRLRERSPGAFEEARRYYEEILLPRVAEETADPVDEWFEYGRRLAELGGPGRIVAIDDAGRAAACAPPLPRNRLVLHLPDDPAEPALVLNLPRALSAPQHATFDLLVAGRTEITDD